MKSCKKATTIGGQALIEGIMMKGPGKTAIAVRLPDGGISVEYMAEKRIRDKYKILGWPVIRGAVTFVESMISGYKALMYSADKSGFSDLEEEKPAPESYALPVLSAEADGGSAGIPADGEDGSETPAALATAPADAKPDEKASAEKKEEKENKFFTLLMSVAMVLGVALALVLFMWLPATLFNLFNKGMGGGLDNWRSLFEGSLKMLIFIGYIAAVSLMKDIKRVFMYHGAEHKTIFCYEGGQELTVENVRGQRRFHPRCGTSFMILMLIVSILISAIVSISIPAVTKITAVWVLIKLLLLPVICGVGYELIRVCGRHNNLITRIISAPGMWLQRLTTKEPDDSMIEVAIASLNAVIPENPDEDRW